jgi:hypothetical protein
LGWRQVSKARRTRARVQADSRHSILGMMVLLRLP